MPDFAFIPVIHTSVRLISLSAFIRAPARMEGGGRTGADIRGELQPHLSCAEHNDHLRLLGGRRRCEQPKVASPRAMLLPDRILRNFLRQVAAQRAAQAEALPSEARYSRSTQASTRKQCCYTILQLILCCKNPDCGAICAAALKGRRAAANISGEDFQRQIAASSEAARAAALGRRRLAVAPLRRPLPAPSLAIIAT